MYSKYITGCTVETEQFDPITGRVKHIVDDYDNADDARDALVARNLDPNTVNTCIWGHGI
jgi:hypothetical protein